MPTTNDQGSADDHANVSRLTDDQARAIVGSGTSGGTGWSGSSDPGQYDWNKERQLNIAARAEWRKSEEGRRLQRRRMALLVAFIAVFIATTCGTFALIVLVGLSWRDWSLLIFSGALVEVSLIVFFSYAAVGERDSYVAFKDAYVAKDVKQESVNRFRTPGEEER